LSSFFLHGKRRGDKIFYIVELHVILMLVIKTSI
jgi:hypothetical protein